MWNVTLPEAKFIGPNSPHDEISRVVNEVYYSPVVSIDTETTGLVKWKDVPLYWSIAYGSSRYTLHASTLAWFRPCFEQVDKTWVLANAKYDMHMLANVGFHLFGGIQCIQVMHGLLYESMPHKLKEVAKHLLGWTWADFQDQFGKITKTFSPQMLIERAERENFSLLVEYASNDAWGTLKCWEELKRQLEAAPTYSLFRDEPPYIDTLWDFFTKIEAPYTKVLWKMERRGIKVDRARFAAARPEAEAKIAQLLREITSHAGFPLNPNSPAQVGQYMESKYKPTKFTKGGKTSGPKPSWDADVLESHKNDPVVARILEYRDYSKLLGTYIIGLHDILDPYDRIHSNFNQDVARCMPAGELVLTKNGYVPVQDVRVGDLVLTHKNRWRPVVEVSKHPPTEIILVKTVTGQQLRTNAEHKYLTGLVATDGDYEATWTAAKDLDSSMECFVHCPGLGMAPTGVLAVYSLPYLEEVYGLTVEEDHSHVTGGIVTHNTGRLSCVAEWTRIHTRRGHVPIKEVHVGDEVYTHKKQWKRVTRTINKGPGLMYDVRFSNGEVLTCTTDHRLLTSTGWQTLGGILEHLQEVGLGPEQPHLSACVVPFHGTAHTGGHSGEARDDVPLRLLRREQVHGLGGEESSGTPSVLSVENWVKEPHEGQDRGTPPQLERLVRRWVRIPDLSTQGQTDVCTPGSIDDSSRTEELAEGVCGSPHRRGQEEQCAGQPGGSHSEWAQDLTLPASEGLALVVIEEVVTRGVYEVHDITVEDDASYAACGVFSHNSSDPNLQNIPRPENDHWNLRQAFVTEPGYKILDIDYSQLEMRLLAAASGQEEMIDVFRRGWDIHAGNAALMFDTAYDDINESKDLLKAMKKVSDPTEAVAIAEAKLPGIQARAGAAGFTVSGYLTACAEYRNAAKSIGFGLNYGMGPKKLANNLGITQADAEDKIAQYMGTYPAVERFMKEALEEARTTGYAYTVLGRRRNVSMVLSNNRKDRSLGERLAVNTQIQGSAADVVRCAHANIDTLGLDIHYNCWSVLQVHDELVYECPAEAVATVKPIIEQMMAHPFFRDLPCPLEAEAGVGDSWGDAK